jgi:SAM-dependent methyltransferase
MSSTTVLSADLILETGQAFWKARALFSAVECDLFTTLAMAGALDLHALSERVALHERGARDFLDALVALGLLERSDDGRYGNTAETDLFLDRRKPTYVGAYLEMSGARLYSAWLGLTTALRTGRPTTPEAKDELADPYGRLYADDVRRDLFLAGMTGGVLPVAQTIAARFPWGGYGSVVDIGCAEGCLLMHIVQAHAHIEAHGFDLPPVAPSFARFVTVHGVAGRVLFHPGDFLTDPWPRADVVVLGRVLHNWDLAIKRRLLAQAWEALPVGGALLVYERLIDDERRTNVSALLASLNMLITTPGGFDFTAADCIAWMKDAGFRDTRVEPLVSGHAMVVAVK